MLNRILCLSVLSVPSVVKNNSITGHHILGEFRIAMLSGGITFPA
jgi:hypothetical protein